MGFPGLPILWVVAGDFLQDGERHVVDVVTREVEVGPGGLVQPLVSHIAKVFCPSLLYLNIKQILLIKSSNLQIINYNLKDEAKCNKNPESLFTVMHSAFGTSQSI